MKLDDIKTVADGTPWGECHYVLRSQVVRGRYRRRVRVVLALDKGRYVIANGQCGPIVKEIAWGATGIMCAEWVPDVWRGDGPSVGEWQLRVVSAGQVQTDLSSWEEIERIEAEDKARHQAAHDEVQRARDAIKSKVLGSLGLELCDEVSLNERNRRRGDAGFVLNVSGDHLVAFLQRHADLPDAADLLDAIAALEYPTC